MMPMRPSLVFACCCMDSGGITRAIASSYAGEMETAISIHLSSSEKIFIVTLLLVLFLSLTLFFPFIFSIDGDSIPVCFFPLLLPVEIRQLHARSQSEITILLY